MNSRLKFVVVTASTCLTLLLLLGTVLGNSTNPEGAYRHLAVYTEVLQRIKSEYVEEPDMKSVTVGALNGMLESIDPFASYLNADQYKDYLKRKDEKKASAGLVLAKKYGYLGVVGVIPNGPAARGGLSTGDMIEAINGVATRDMPLAYAMLLLQGEPGTSVELSVVRVRRPEPHKLTLTRAMVAYPAVESRMLPNRIGYVRPETLVKGKVEEVSQAVRNLQQQGAQRLVLDLRNAALGSPEDGVELADLFMDKGLIAYLQGQRVPKQEFHAKPGETINLPLVVITNRGTSTGAEVAAAAIMDSKRGQLVGEKTYGDAAVRRTITMDDGGAIILSVAKYYTPSGKPIPDNGVTPQHQLAEPDAQPELDENGDPIESPETAPRKSDEDPLLKKAVEVVTAIKA